jgi:hypothetical protein
MSPLHYVNPGQFYHNNVIQWKPLNVITDNVIIRLMLSLYERPGLIVQTTNN